MQDIGGSAPLTEHVAVGAIVDHHNQVLIAKRKKHVHLGGLWEFPGGKREQNETIVEALHRELFEELGITVTNARPLFCISHTYPEKSVILDVWLVTEFSGEPHGKEGQPIVWVSKQQLYQYNLPAVDRPIISALRLPRECAIVTVNQDLSELQLLLARGIKLIILDATTCTNGLPYHWLLTAQELCQRANAEALVAPTLGELFLLPQLGLHLDGSALSALQSRPINKDVWFGVTCHNEVELFAAHHLDADFIIYPGQDLTSAQPIIHSARIPVYWQPENKQCTFDWSIIFAAGAQGLVTLPTSWEKQR